MDDLDKKDMIQAILIADNNIENFRPLSDNNSTALMPLVNVTILDYALEALNRSGIEEVFVFTSLYLQNVRDHIEKGIASLSSWSVNMKVHVIGGEGCRCFGDAMRELDGKALIRGNFVLLGADTITNADLRPIFEQHKKTLKYDKGAAATLIFKEAEIHLRTGSEVMIAMDTQNNRLHHHHRLSITDKETYFDIPLEVFINNSQVALLHNLLDPQIAIGSPSMLSLFSDNFDFETRDDFVRGILINEEILNARIYVSLLPRGQYARKVNNWLTYQIVSNDIINRWVYPLVPDMGIVKLKQQYICLKNNIYRSPTANLAKVTLGENVVVHKNSVVGAGSTLNRSVFGHNNKVGPHCRIYNSVLHDNIIVEDYCVLECSVVYNNTVVGASSTLKCSVLGNNNKVGKNSRFFDSLLHDNVVVMDNCLLEGSVVRNNSVVGASSTLKCSVLDNNVKVGKNCRIFNSHLHDNVLVMDNCVVENRDVPPNSIIKANTEIKDGCNIGESCVLPANIKLSKSLVTSSSKIAEEDSSKKLSDKAFIINDKIHQRTLSENDVPAGILVLKMMKLPVNQEESDYNSSSDEDESRAPSPLQDDTNIFLSEVVDSLSRGFQEKSNPDFLILEINSSRYAYNMSLKEVNFNVVKAIFSLPNIKEPSNNNVLIEINAVLKQLGPVMSNYIKSEEAMLDCLKALEDIYEENEFVREKISQIIHYLYDKDFVTEDAVLSWYEQLNEEEHAKLRKSLLKLIEWLQQSSDEDDDDDESD